MALSRMKRRHRAAAVKIQAVVRGRSVRTNSSQMVRSLLVVQAVVRAHQRRRGKKSAEVMQRAQRCHVARGELASSQDAKRLVDEANATEKARAEAEERARVENESAGLLQRAHRSHTARGELETRKVAAEKARVEAEVAAEKARVEAAKLAGVDLAGLQALKDALRAVHTATADLKRDKERVAHDRWTLAEANNLLNRLSDAKHRAWAFARALLLLLLLLVSASCSVTLPPRSVLPKTSSVV
jgi:hypothetical protein